MSSWNPLGPGATDMEIALFLIAHVENPCEVAISPDFRKTVQEFYIREARRVLKNLTNEDARKLLDDKIKEYESP